MRNQYLANIPLHIMFVSLPLYFIFVIEKKNFDEFIREIKLEKIRIFDVLQSIVFFIALLIILAIFSFLLREYNQTHQNNMITLIKSLNSLLLIFAIFLAPFTEELFFRAFLSKRLGILSSSMLFAIFHINYMSLIQFIASFVIGLALALIFKRYNLNTCIYIHLLFNLTSIVIVKFFL
ncbi:MAG: CPBP family intramembrane glutamic endopeptidase [Candidatus Anstonellales archaeon]